MDEESRAALGADGWRQRAAAATFMSPGSLLHAGLVPPFCLYAVKRLFDTF